MEDNKRQPIPDNFNDTKKFILEFLNKKLDSTIRYEGESFSLSEMGNSLYIKMLNGNVYKLELNKHFNIEVVEDTTPEAPDKIPSAEEYFHEYLVKAGYEVWQTDSRDVIKMLESYALLREQRAVEQARKKWETEKRILMNADDAWNIFEILKRLNYGYKSNY